MSKLASFCGYFTSPESGPSGAKAYLRAAVLWPRYEAEAEAAAAIANTTEVAFAADIQRESPLSWSIRPQLK